MNMKRNTADRMRPILEAMERSIDQARRRRLDRQPDSPSSSAAPGSHGALPRPGEYANGGHGGGSPYANAGNHGAGTHSSGGGGAHPNPYRQSGSSHSPSSPAPAASPATPPAHAPSPLDRTIGRSSEPQIAPRDPQSPSSPASDDEPQRLKAKPKRPTPFRGFTAPAHQPQVG